MKEEKRILRQHIIEERRNLNADLKARYDQYLCEQLWHFIEQEKSDYIHCFLPMDDEINLYPLLTKMLDHGKIVFTSKSLPKRQLVHLRLRSLDDLEPGIFGTRHPKDSEAYSGPFDLIVVPCLACDRNGFRLGYGGGYYDTFLSQYPDAFTIGMIYPFQQYAILPVETHDIPLRRVMIAEDNAE